MNPIYNVVSLLLDDNTALRGDKTAIYHGEQKISYRLLSEQVNRFGNLLRDLGIQPGERIVIAMPDSPYCLYAFLGSIKSGAWPVLISPQLLAATYSFILEDSGAALLFTTIECEATGVKTEGLRHVVCADDEGFEAMLMSSPCELDPHPSSESDIAFMLYSSGSTGKPKGVPHRHRDIPFTADAFGKNVLNLSSEDIILSASKLFFAYGLGNSLSFPLRFGGSVVLHPLKSTGPDMYGLISKYRPTLFFGVPTLYNMMLKTWEKAYDLDSLRLCVSAGEALPASVYLQWKELTGIEIIDGIGSTEALHIFISNRPRDVRPGTSGFAVPGYEARILRNNGSPAPDGEPGHLHIRGKSTAPYYWNKSEKTAETMLSGGWLDTGDIYIREDGCFICQGRADDMFKVDANWVSPTQVENTLREHPAVLECAVTPRKLESLCKTMAHVVLNPGFHGDMKLFRDIRSFVLSRLPDYMCPVQILFCEELPKTETGKIQRFRLREEKTSNQ
ncbi:MAG: benzoate-CoA ligase family protein [Syntrophobacteraceae bacterium]